jgi:helicase MOV-10
MTRAQALLIIIGEPAVLSLEPLWRAFLNYIHRSGGWTGKRIDWDDDDDEAINFLEQRQSKAKNQMDDLVSRLQDLVLEDRESDSEDGDDVHDRPWREDE